MLKLTFMTDDKDQFPSGKCLFWSGACIALFYAEVPSVPEPRAANHMNGVNMGLMELQTEIFLTHNPPYNFFNLKNQQHRSML